MNKFNLMIVLIGSLFIAACEAPQQDNQAQKSKTEKVHKVQTRSIKPGSQLPQETSKMNETMTYTGTVKHYSMEGGFFGIITTGGDKFLPKNLAAKYMREGTVISFSGHIDNNTMSIQQWGTLFTIEKITLIKQGSAVNDESLQ